MKKEKGLKHLLLAFNFSAHGLCSACKREAAFVHELLLGIPHMIGLVLIPMPMVLRLVLFGLWVQLLVVELINSAIEAMVDLVSPGYHELARIAKDYGSAAIFLILCLFVGCWLYVLLKFAI